MTGDDIRAGRIAMHAGREGDHQEEEARPMKMPESERAALRISIRIGEALRAKRGDVSLRDYAPEVGISASTLYRIEGGQFPDFRDLVLIARHLGPRFTAKLFAGATHD